jgi:hypothetical protein
MAVSTWWSGQDQDCGPLPRRGSTRAVDKVWGQMRSLEGRISGAPPSSYGRSANDGLEEDDP